MKRLLHASGLVLALTLAGCGDLPTRQAAVSPGYAHLLHDERFGARPAEVDRQRVFALDDAMLRYVHDVLPKAIHDKGAVRGLLDALYDRGQLKLEYDAARTRTASEAFAARQGNCLSLVIMTGALAREMKIDVRYQQVYVDTEWHRQGDLLVYTDHVNLRLDARRPDWKTLSREGTALVVDFLPSPDAGRQIATEISEATIMAMFMNNRAAESIGTGELRTAYWWAREALAHDARFMPAYNTLALVYARSGMVPAAIDVLDEALRRSPEDVLVLANLAGFLREAGRLADADRVEARLRTVEPVAPYHWFQRGLAALKAGQFLVARDFFDKELARQPYNAEFHFAMAATFIGMGDLTKARRHFEQAREYSTTTESRALYSAKLEMIQRRMECSKRGDCDRHG